MSVLHLAEPGQGTLDNLHGYDIFGNVDSLLYPSVACRCGQVGPGLDTATAEGAIIVHLIM